MSNFRPLDRDTGFLLPPSVDEWLPEKHLARFVVEVIDSLDLRAMSGAYRGSGSASYHPALLLGLLIYGYATGVFSSRKLERASYAAVASRFIAANAHPDHDTIAAFRRADRNIWFTEAQGNKIGRLAATGEVSEFPVPTPNSRPQGIAPGPDGNLWFTESQGNKIGRITPSGAITEYSVAIPHSYPFGITAGPDGALWFTLAVANTIGRISVSGQLRYFQLAETVTPYGIARGPDNNLWFTGFSNNAIGRITPAGRIMEFPLAGSAAEPFNIAAGPDGDLWFTEPGTNSIGRITIEGRVTVFSLRAGGRKPYSITPARGGLWFTLHLGGKIGRIGLSGVTSEIEIPNVRILKGITAASDGTIWFAAASANSIGRYR